MLRLRASASAISIRARGEGCSVIVAMSAASGPIDNAGCACNVPAASPPTVNASAMLSKRIGMLLKFSMRRSTDQLPSARTVSCWMLAVGSETRRTGPLLHADNAMQHSTASAIGKRFMWQPRAWRDGEDTRAQVGAAHAATSVEQALAQGV